MARTFEAGRHGSSFFGDINGSSMYALKQWVGKIICCYILIVDFTLGQLGTPDVLISGPYQNFSVEIDFLIEISFPGKVCWKNSH